MPCYKPLDGYSSAYVNASGSRRIVFHPAKSNNPREIIPIPCGRCIGCRLDKSKAWALRCHHEASLYGEKNVFLTLTYSDDKLPDHSSLYKPHFQKFIRALRDKTKQKIRYYMCGEYGDKTERPHYHAILFNYKFPDSKFFTLRNSNRVYTSEMLTKLWPHGLHEIGSVSFRSAGYVAQYILKKQNGVRGDIAYKERHRIPPYTQMSLRPGIGKKWYEKYKSDLFPHDFAITPDGRKMPVPHYYTNLLKKEDPDLYELLKAQRLEKAINSPDNTDSRLEAREICAIAKTTPRESI